MFKQAPLKVKIAALILLCAYVPALVVDTANVLLITVVTILIGSAVVVIEYLLDYKKEK